MKKLSVILTAIALLAGACPAIGQALHDGKMCQFYNIDKTIKAKIGTGEDVAFQLNTVKAFWPVMLNGKECTKLQEGLCQWLTGRDDIKQMDRAIENALFTDNESVTFGDNGPYIIVDKFSDDDFPISSSTNIIELKRLGKRFATFHMIYDVYFAGAAHGMYGHNYMTYDTELDKIVTLEDVLLDPELIRPYILKSIELKHGYLPEDLFLPEDNVIPIPNLFYFEDGLLHLVYQPYEIASYAQGVIEVPIFYPHDKSLPEYLTSYGKLVMEESVDDDLW